MVQTLTNKLLAYSITGPGITPGTTTSGSITKLESIISTIIGIMTIFGVIFFVIQIIIAGFAMISSKGDPKALETNNKRLVSNIIGLGIIVIAYGAGAFIASLLGMDNIFSLSTIFAPIN